MEGSQSIDTGRDQIVTEKENRFVVFLVTVSSDHYGETIFVCE